MKKRFLKKSLLALSMVCSLASGSVKAMEDEQIREQQNRALAESMFVDSVAKNDEFCQLFEAYKSLGISEEANLDAYKLQTKMKSLF
jgi:hypothetical protein